VWQLAVGTYVVVVAALTALVARRKDRDTIIWFVGGFAGGFPILLLALIAPRAGRAWRSRAFVAIAMFAAIALGIVLLIVAISEANFVTP
jgi:VIT1/CCC1 family predicted Fe2+/Mn2+ transporter